MGLATRMNEAIQYGKKLQDTGAFAQAMKELDIDDFLEDRKNVFGINSTSAYQEWRGQLELLRDPEMLSQVDPGDLREMVVDQIEFYERNLQRKKIEEEG